MTQEWGSPVAEKSPLRTLGTYRPGSEPRPQVQDRREAEPNPVYPSSVTMTNQDPLHARTLADIAKQAGVHPTTVSRIMAGKSHHISPETRTRVLEAARQIGYIRQGQKTIPVVGYLDRLQFSPAKTVFADLPRLLAYSLDRYDYDLSYIGVLDADAWKRRQRTALLRGLITVDISLHEQEHLFDLVQGPVVVIVGDDTLRCDTITTDDSQGMTEGMKLLIAHGHRRFAFIIWPVNLHPPSLAARWNAVASAAAAVGGSACQTVWGGGAVTALLRGDDPPTALIFYDNLVYEDAMIELRASGIKVPDDVSILCGNDALCLDLAYPRPAAIDICLNDMAKAAVDLLMQRINGTGPSSVARIRISQELIPGETIGPPRIS